MQETATNPFTSIFFQSNPGVNKELRQRIALAMLVKQQKAAPKNFGEGLTAIGDAIAERSLMKQIENSDLAAQAAGRADLDRLMPPAAASSTATPAAYALPGTASADPSDEPSPAPVAPHSSLAPPPIQPAPGALPPTGEPGNTGATTFPPPFQTTPAQRDAMQPPRLPVLDQKNFNSIDAMAPNAPPALARSAEPSAPAPAAEDPRRAIAMTMMKQGQLGQPQSTAFAPSAPPAAPPPDQAMQFAGAPTPADAPAQSLMPTPAPAAPPPQRPAPMPPPVSRETPPPPPAEQYPPGYVIPEPTGRAQRQIIPQSPREMELFRAYHTTTNEYSKPAIGALLAREVEQRKQRQDEVDKLFEADIKLRNDQTMKRFDQQADSAKRKADVKKTVVETATGRLKEIDGRPLEMGDDGIYRPPTIDGIDPNAPPAGKLTKEQGDTLKFLNQMYITAEQLKGKQKILAEGWASELAGKVPFAGNALMERHYRMAKRAAEVWVAANLRDISGAVIGTKEHADQMKWIMPAIGDDAEEIRRKAVIRDTIMDGMKRSMGTQANHADHARKTILDGLKATAAKIEAEMEGVPKDGKIYRNPANPKQRRQWDHEDKVWREL
jgi:hypothetical protein